MIYFSNLYISKKLEITQMSISRRLFVGWAACCSETGWTDAEILMGLMLPEILEQSVAPHR